MMSIWRDPMRVVAIDLLGKINITLEVFGCAQWSDIHSGSSPLTNLRPTSLFRQEFAGASKSRRHRACGNDKKPGAQLRAFLFLADCENPICLEPMMRHKISFRSSSARMISSYQNEA